MKSKKQFVQLHNHTDFSLLDGALKIKDLVEKVARDGAPAVGITDHGTPAGLIKLAQEAKKAGIIAVPGLEGYHVPDVTKARELARSDGKSRYHLTLLGVSDRGYRNILELSSEAAIENYFYQPLMDDRMLAEHSEGVVATSGCLGSRFNQALLADDLDLARTIASEHRSIFGERYFIEVQDHGIPDQRRITPHHLAISRDLGIPLLATNDAHYLEAGDAKMHDALLCLQTGKPLSDPDRFKFSSDENYVRTADEMWSLFPEEDYPGACSNTLLVAEMASGFEIETGGRYLIPRFETDAGEDPAVALRRLVLAGLERLYGEGGTLAREVVERAEYELRVIHDMGFDDYFLVVGDMVNWAKSNDIAVGPGRGSAAGSIVAYALSITTVDPLRYGLYFERFLNPGRKSMPDIDIDFEPEKRYLVQQYVAEKYGRDRVAYIATYGSLKAKSSILSAARVLGLPAKTGAGLSALWPGVINQVVATLPEVLGEEPTSEKTTEHWKRGASLRARAASDEDAGRVLALAESIEGVQQTRGIHAAALLITPTKLTDYVPIHRSKDESLSVCAYDKDDSEAIGGLKMDLLGLINLSIIKQAVKLVKRDVGDVVDVENLPLDDPKVYRMLSEGDTASVFQLEGDGITKLVTRLRPTRVEDLSAILALYRPGPMGSDMHTDYADRKNGRQKVTAPHEGFKTLFAETYGLVTYQEQMLLLAQHYAGFTAAEADDLRKATGKKDAAKMASIEPRFKSGMTGNGYAASLADTIWELLPPFAAYSFNKAHSMAYAMISYQCAWLKSNYPAQWAAACIDFMPRDRVPLQVEVVKGRGIEVFSPDINRSFLEATTDHGSVWLGIGGIANCGESTMRSIIRERSESGPFRSLHDFVIRTTGRGVTKRSISSLVDAGCFDSLHPSRRAMSEEEVIASIVDRARTVNTDLDDEDGLFGDLLDETVGLVEDLERTHPFDGPDFSLQERIVREVAALGFAAGSHPFAIVEKYVPGAKRRGLVPSDAVPVGDSSVVEGRRVTIYGTLARIEEKKTKSGKPMTTFVVETGRGPRVGGVVVGRELYGARAGAFVVLTGVPKSDARSEDDEESNLSVMADEIAVHTLDAVIAAGTEREAPVRSAAVVEHGDVEPEAPRAVGSPRGTAPTERFVFRVRSADRLGELAAEIRNVPEGSATIAVYYRGESVDLPATGYDLDRPRARLIAERVGVVLAD